MLNADTGGHSHFNPMKRLPKKSKTPGIRHIGFAHLVAVITGLSPKRHMEYPEDLLNSLCSEGQSLILTRPRENDDVVWDHGQHVDERRDYFWPFAVNGDDLFVPPYKRHFHMTRKEVLEWDRATTTIPKFSMPYLVTMLKGTDHGVRAIVEGNDDVVVVFQVEADDFLTWTRECRRVQKLLKSQKIDSGKFLLHNLIPISDTPSTPGALIYLA